MMLFSTYKNSRGYPGLVITSESATEFRKLQQLQSDLYFTCALPCGYSPSVDLDQRSRTLSIDVFTFQQTVPGYAADLPDDQPEVDQIQESFSI